MEYLAMRKVVTAASMTLLGASLVIFLTALLIPLIHSPTTPELAEVRLRKSGNFAAGAAAESKPPQKARLDTPPATPADRTVPAKPNTAEAEPAGTAFEAKPEQPAANHPPVSVPHEMPAATPLPDKPAEPPPASVETSKRSQQQSSLLVLSDGAFSPGVAKPKERALAAIADIVPLIRARPTEYVIIEGHADNSAPEGFSPEQAWKWNRIVSMLRARAVAQALQRKGVAGKRIIVRGLGDTAPLASNKTRKGRSANRRVEIRLSAARR